MTSVWAVIRKALVVRSCPKNEDKMWNGDQSPKSLQTLMNKCAFEIAYNVEKLDQLSKAIFFYFLCSSKLN